MSQGNETALRFSLEESVWFQKGQEVAELMSISLDPNITIHENEQYVTIEGALHLTGEYKRYEDEYSEEDFPYTSKFIQQVEDREEGISEFAHQFPVDITIPINRIHNIYDIDVAIDSFDYVFPERSCLKLTADLTITGLYDGLQQQNDVKLVSIVDERTPQAIEVAEGDVDQLEEIPIVSYEEKSTKVDAELLESFEAEARKNNVSTSPPAIEKKSNQTWKQENAFLFEEKEKLAPEITYSSQREEAQKATETAHNQNEQYESTENELDFVDEFEEEESATVTAEVTKKKKKKKQGISITEFLSRKEEEQVAKLKVCIVQTGDTIDRLAERYDVSPQQILHENQLSINQDVYEGQVLYIPATVKRR